MELSPHVEALLADAAEVAAVGDEATVDAARRLAVALRSAAGLRLQDALTEATLELSAQLPSGHVELRLAGQDVSFVYVEEEAAASPAPPEDGLTARITLRLPEGLKAGIEAAAASEGLSINAWIVRALSRSTGGTTRRGPGSRLTGFARG